MQPAIGMRVFLAQSSFCFGNHHKQTQRQSGNRPRTQPTSSAEPCAAPPSPNPRALHTRTFQHKAATVPEPCAAQLGCRQCGEHRAGLLELPTRLPRPRAAGKALSISLRLPMAARRSPCLYAPNHGGSLVPGAGLGSPPRNHGWHRNTVPRKPKRPQGTRTAARPPRNNPHLTDLRGASRCEPRH